MQKIMNRVRDDAKKQGFTFEKIGKHLGYSKGQISNFFSCKNNINFLVFIKMLELVYEDKTDIIYDILKEFSFRTESIMNVRLSFEWFYNHGKLEDIEKLLNKYEYDPFIKVYKVIFDNRYRNLTRFELLNNIEHLKETLEDCEEAKILNRILSLYAYIDYKSYVLIPDLAISLFKRIELLEDSYFKESFKYRITESLVYAYLKQANLYEVEKITNSIVSNDNIKEQFPMFYTQILMLLSEAFVFSNYKKSIFYITEAINHYYKKKLRSPYREKALRSTADFIRIYHRNFENLYLEDVSEKIHFLSVQNKYDKQKVLELLEELKQKQNGRLSPFQLYYKALVTRNLQDINESLIEFERQGDVHYAKLPKALVKSTISKM